MLRLMRRSDDAKIADLARTILESKEGAGVFEYFADETTAPTLLPILSAIHSELRRQHGVAADLKQNDGVFAVWRVARRTLDRTAIEPWLIDELLQCVPGYLRLLNSIYYFWLGTDAHTRAEREPVRAAILHACQDRLARADDTTVCNSFDPTFPWVLFHLVFTTDFEHPETVPYGSHTDWSWIGPVLLRAAAHCAATLIPQLVIVANSFDTRRREVITYRFNEQLLRDWFAENTATFLAAVKDFRPESAAHALEPNALGYLRAAMDAAQQQVPLSS